LVLIIIEELSPIPQMHIHEYEIVSVNCFTIRMGLNGRKYCYYRRCV